MERSRALAAASLLLFVFLSSTSIAPPSRPLKIFELTASQVWIFGHPRERDHGRNGEGRRGDVASGAASEERGQLPRGRGGRRGRRPRPSLNDGGPRGPRGRKQRQRVGQNQGGCKQPLGFDVYANYDIHVSKISIKLNFNLLPLQA